MMHHANARHTTVTHDALRLHYASHPTNYRIIRNTTPAATIFGADFLYNKAGGNTQTNERKIVAVEKSRRRDRSIRRLILAPRSHFPVVVQRNPARKPHLVPKGGVMSWMSYDAITHNALRFSLHLFSKLQNSSHTKSK